MAKEKNKPVPVRFNLKLLETLKEEEKIDTPQQALNFLSNFWENNRPARDGSAIASMETTTSVPRTATTPDQIVKTEKRTAVTHPSGLSGIDLSIWRAEQKEENKDV